MCSTPKIPSTPVVDTTPPPTIATPTAADAKVTKAGAATRSNAQNGADRNIKTTSRGLTEDATTTKKGLLGE